MSGFVNIKLNKNTHDQAISQMVECKINKEIMLVLSLHVNL